MNDGEQIISAEAVGEYPSDMPNQLKHISQVPVGEIWRDLPRADGSMKRLVGLGEVLGVFLDGAAFGYRFAQLEARLNSSDPSQPETLADTSPNLHQP